MKITIVKNSNLKLGTEDGKSRLFFANGGMIVPMMKPTADQINKIGMIIGLDLKKKYKHTMFVSEDGKLCGYCAIRKKAK